MEDDELPIPVCRSQTHAASSQTGRRRVVVELLDIRYSWCYNHVILGTVSRLVCATRSPRRDIVHVTTSASVPTSGNIVFCRGLCLTEMVQ